MRLGRSRSQSSLSCVAWRSTDLAGNAKYSCQCVTASSHKSIFCRHCENRRGQASTNVDHLDQFLLLTWRGPSGRLLLHMGIFRKAATKLHISKGSSGKHGASTTGHLKHDYESEPVSEAEAAAPKNVPNSGQGEGSTQPTAAQAQVQEAQKPETFDKDKRGPARLVLEHAPKAPPWARKGLDDNTTYTMHRPEDSQDPAAAVQQQSYADPAAAGGQAVPGSSFGTGTSGMGQNGAQASQAQRDQRAAAVIPDGATKQSPAQQPSGTLVQASTVGKLALLVWIFATLIYIQLFNISLLGMILPFLLLGMPTGIGLSWLFFYQKGAKKKISAQVGLTQMASRLDFQTSHSMV